jgi:hypothetical protein
VLGVQDEDTGRLAVGDQLQQVLLRLVLIGKDLGAGRRFRCAAGRAMAPHRDDGDRDHQQRQAQHDGERAEPGIGCAQRLFVIDGVHQHPWRTGDGACGHHHAPAGIVAQIGSEAVALRHRKSRVQVGRRHFHGHPERLRRLTRPRDRREICHLVPNPGEQHGGRGPGRIARLVQQGVELPTHPLDAHDAADLGTRRLIGLHREQRHHEGHGGLAVRIDGERTGCGPPGRDLVDEIPQRAIERRRIGRCRHDLACSVHDQDSARGNIRRVEVRLLFVARFAEAAAGRGHQQQVAQILAKAFDLVLLRRIGAELVDRADIKLDRLVPGERVEVGHVAGQPAIDFGHAAVSDDAEAHLPLRQLALAFFVHEPVDGPDADDAQHDEDYGREQDLEIEAALRSAGFEHPAGRVSLGSPIGPRLRRGRATLNHCPLLGSSV